MVVPGYFLQQQTLKPESVTMVVPGYLLQVYIQDCCTDCPVTVIQPAQCSYLSVIKDMSAMYLLLLIGWPSRATTALRSTSVSSTTPRSELDC